jgi:regulatory protein
MAGGGRRTSPGPLSGIITRLSVLSGRPERTSLYLDGRRAGDIATEVVESAGLRKGEFLSEETLATLLHQDEPHRARSRALGLLSVRDRSSAEVRSRLQLIGFSPDTISATIGWLVGLGYLDDARFAERYAAEKSRAGWGERRIRSELLRKGIDRTALDVALASATGDEASEEARMETLMALVRRRFGRQWQEDRESAERRLAGFLARRGYDWDTVTKIVRQLDDEEASARP